MTHSDIDLNPTQHITVDAIGAPGKRVFYLQGWNDLEPAPVTVIIEKLQLQNLIPGIVRVLEEIAESHPDRATPAVAFDPEKMRILPPVDPLFRAGDLGIGYQTELDQVVLFAREILLDGAAEEDAAMVRFWCTRQQARLLADWGLEVLQRGRPICPQCGEPMEADGHFCPKKNGHKKK